ncbi:hypothetical protein [Chryseobacterium gambrini]|uniref:hypothetical protein n=1 Tax=Chryseobacterium gambrini TaxID=373672 RepID=UPI003D0ACA08
MKTSKLILTISCLFFYTFCFSQKEKYVSLFKPQSRQGIKDSVLFYYKADIDILNIDFDKTKKEDKWVLNNGMLSQFFNNEISSFAASMKDLSLEPNIVSVNSENKTITIGKNILLQNNKDRLDKDLRKISNVLSVSVSSSIDKNFSKIYSKNNKTNEYDFASEINLNLKFTHIGNNSIWVTSNSSEKITDFRDKKISSYLNEEFKNDKDFKIKIEEKDSVSFITKKYYEYYKKISEKEVKNIKDNTLFSSYSLHWYGFNLGIPLTKKVINVKSTKTVGTFDSEEFYSWKAEAFFNYLYNVPKLKWLKGSTFNFRVSGSIFNNNNFIADNANAVTFQSIIDQNTIQQVLSPADLVFIGEYKRLTTTALKAEGSSLFFENTIGISAALEKNLGDYDALNWKLGVPVSLKDKDKKPTLNFELQWREVNRQHMVGISAGYIFGKFVR